MDHLSPLHKSVVNEKYKTVLALVKRGADLNAKEPDEGNTPLHLAAINGNKEILKLLLDSGVDVKVKNNEGSSALQYALDKQDFEIIKIFIDAGVDINSKSPKLGETALHLAIKEKNILFVNELLTHGADVNLKNFEGLTPLEYALDYSDLDKAKILINAGADVNSRGKKKGLTALHLAVENNYLPLVEDLLGRGADVNVKDKHSQMPLHLAVIQNDRYNSNLRVIELLLKNKADANAQDNKGMTTLHYAMNFSSVQNKIFELLLKYKADVNVKNDKGFTVLNDVLDFCGNSTFLQNYDLDLVKMLIDAGGDVNSKSVEYGSTALHFAAKTNYYNMIIYLLSRGADVDVTDKKNQTPLHVATNESFKSHLTAIEILLQHESDVNAVDKSGNTPLTYVEKKPLAGLVELFLKYVPPGSAAYKRLNKLNKIMI